MCEPFLLNTFHSQAQWAETRCEVSQLGELWVCVGLYTKFQSGLLCFSISSHANNCILVSDITLYK